MGFLRFTSFRVRNDVEEKSARPCFLLSPNSAPAKRRSIFAGALFIGIQKTPRGKTHGAYITQTEFEAESGNISQVKGDGGDVVVKRAAKFL